MNASCECGNCVEMNHLQSLYTSQHLNLMQPSNDRQESVLQLKNILVTANLAPQESPVAPHCGVVTTAPFLDLEIGPNKTHFIITCVFSRNICCVFMSQGPERQQALKAPASYCGAALPCL